MPDALTALTASEARAVPAVAAPYVKRGQAPLFHALVKVLARERSGTVGHTAWRRVAGEMTWIVMPAGSDPAFWDVCEIGSVSTPDIAVAAGLICANTPVRDTASALALLAR